MPMKSSSRNWILQFFSVKNPQKNFNRNRSTVLFKFMFLEYNFAYFGLFGELGSRIVDLKVTDFQVQYSESHQKTALDKDICVSVLSNTKLEMQNVP